jgi:hypothetical protein
MKNNIIGRSAQLLVQKRRAVYNILALLGDEKFVLKLIGLVI